jgi:predicted kinase
VPPLPTLVVVSGPAGSGKTTLARAIASAVGCPAISRDEIKEGMVHATWGPAAPAGVAPDRGASGRPASGFVARPGDELTARTLPVFFGVLELLVRAGVTVVAEAAFQDHVWRPRLEPLLGLAQLRIVHCVVDGDLAARRILRRTQDDPSRRAHADLHPETSRLRRTFNRLSLDVPWLEVDTTDGYRPGLDQVVAFVNAPRSSGTDGA